MLHFVGIRGVVTSVLIAAAIFTISYFSKRPIPAYNLDPGGTPGTFEPFLQKYLRFAEFLIGLATGSIVLLVGSSALHGQGGHLPWFFASPLIILSACVLCGLSFIACLILNALDSY